MTGLAKKLSAALLAVIAAVCLAFGLLFIVPKTSAAAEADHTFKEETDFVISNNVLQGLSADAIAQIQGGTFAVEIPSGVTSIAAGSASSSIWGANASRLVSVTLPSTGLTAVGNYAFSGCSALSSLNLGGELETIGNNAFANCTSLTEVSVPQSVTSIGSSAFYKCTSLEAFTYAGSSALGSIGSNAFEGCSSLVTVTVPYNVTSIGANAFKDCSSVSTICYYAKAIAAFATSPFAGISSNEIAVVIGQSGEGNTITTLPVNMFTGSKITSAAFYNVNVSGDSAFTQIFSGCSNLRSVTFDSTCRVTRLGYQSFYNCVSLYQVHIPVGVTAIDSSAFTGCTRLLEVYNQTGNTTLANLPTASNVYTTAGATNLVSNGDFVYYVDGATVYLVDYTGAAQELVLPTDYSGKTYQIYRRAFAGNGALRSVQLPAGISTIYSSTFEGCTSLQSIDIPSSVVAIENSAFKDCSSLTSVKFNPVSGEYKLKSIDYNAFEGCKSLTVIQIPESVNNLGAEVFTKCERLNTVYLPAASNGTYYYSNMFNGCAVGLILIAPTSTDYGTYSGKNLGTSYYLTYVMELKLHSIANSVDEVTSDYRLHGMDYKYVKNSADASWSAMGNMPVQAGYKTSVWYVDNTFAEKITDLNTLLEANVESVDLYAHKLSLDFSNVNLTTTGNTLMYSDGGFNGGLSQENLKSWYTNLDSFNFDQYTISVASYYTYYTRVSMSKTELSDAGVYTLSANINPNIQEDYGVWAEGVKLPEITVHPYNIQLTSDLIWVNGSGNRLEPQIKSDASTDEESLEKLYLYNDIPYLEAQEGKEADDVIDVLYSYLNYSGNAYTIALQANSNNTENFNKWISRITYTGNTGTYAGTYDAIATVTVNNNYRLVVSGNDYEHITVSNVNNIFTVHKTWYIATSASNSLVNSQGTNYTISGWKYNSSSATDPESPIPAYGVTSGGVIEVDLNYTLVMYNISDTSTPVLKVNFDKSDNFNSYINTSMPAGYYELYAEVGGYEEVSGARVVISFTVEAASMYDLVEKADENLYNKSIYVNYNNGKPVAFLGDTSLEILNKAPSQIHPTRRGFWLNNDTYEWTDDSDKKQTFDIASLYSSKFEIEFATTPYGEYHNQLWYTNNNSGFSAIGSSIVYYNIYAPGYQSTDDLFGQGKRTYTLVITQLINAPLNFYVEYNGGNTLRNEIRGQLSSQYYDVIFIDSASVLNTYQATLGLTGTYNYNEAITSCEVVLKIKDEYLTSCNWGTGFAKTSGGVAKYVFTISPATNSSKQALSMNGWEYGTYNKNVNLPSWAAQYGVPSTYIYTLVNINDLNNSEAVRYTLSWENNTAVTDFNEAPVGTYYLYVTVPASANYARYELPRELWLEVKISKSDIVWKTAPYVESFRYEDDDSYAVIEGVLPEYLAEQDIPYTMYYCFKSDFDLGNAAKDETLRFATIKELAASLGYDYLPAGNYALVYSFEEGENNNGADYAVYFNVIASRNYWDITPVIQGWLYGEYSGFNIEYAPHFGKASQVTFQFRYIDENGVKYAAKTKLDDYLDSEGQLPVGTYEYQAIVRATENYTELKLSADDSWLSFKVDKSQNSWVDIPNILGWSESNFSSDINLPTAKPQFGNVYYTIKDANGNEIISNVAASDLSASTLGNLEVGNYTLIASVAGTSDYYELSAETNFAVFEDSVGMTGIIAATMVFAVIAIGLAVTGAVLLVRRNKKIEEEFRKMVRTELRRK